MIRFASLACIDLNPRREKATRPRRSSTWVGKSLAVVSLALPLFGMACSSTSPVVRIAEPVGPAPSSRSFFDEGRLVVYTQVSHSYGDLYAADYPTLTIPLREPYTIFDTEGHEIQAVANHAAGTEPETVNLTNGNYLVRAKGFDGELVDVKVRIDRGKTTEVFLDRSRPPSDFAPTDKVVRASDGAVVGWRATAIGGGPRSK